MVVCVRKKGEKGRKVLEKLQLKEGKIFVSTNRKIEEAQVGLDMSILFQFLGFLAKGSIVEDIYETCN